MSTATSTQDPSPPMQFDLELLGKQSRRAAMSSLIGVLIVLGSLAYSAYTMASLKSRSIELQKNIDSKKAEYDQTDRDLRREKTEVAEQSVRLDDAKRHINTANDQLASLTNDLHSLAPHANTKILAALVQADQIDSTLTVAEASLTKPKIAPAKSDYGSYSVDIFYCGDANSHDRHNANSALSLHEGTSQGRWRIRRLLPEINSQPGYGIRNDVVRYNLDEKLIADRLQSGVMKKLGIMIQEEQIAFPTPNYVSVFFCAGR